MCAKLALPYREARRIINHAHKSHAGMKKIPKREYYCERCQAYHLTSLSHWEGDE